MQMVKATTPVELKDAIIKSIENKKGHSIVCLNMGKVSSSICDYFVICEGNSSVQVDSIAKGVEEEVFRDTGEHVYHAEGYANAEWILLDYVDVVVHIFQPGARSFYNLEGLWADAVVENIGIKN